MKKVLLLLVSIVMFSCSSDDDATSDAVSNGNTSISPPSWIQGKWSSVAGNAYIFTSDDMCQSISLIDICQKQQIAQVSGGLYTNTKEVITDDYYLLEVTLGPATSKFEFKKITNDKIEHVNDGSDSIDTYYTLDK